jgi:hypothetical protein
MSGRTRISRGKSGIRKRASLPVRRPATGQTKALRNSAVCNLSRMPPLELARVAISQAAFVDYRRELTPEGGVLITYKDYDTRWRHTIWRIFSWCTATGCEFWLLANYSPVVSWWINAACLLLAAGANFLIVMKKVEVYRALEIRRDGMIVEGEDVFWLRLIETNWPTLKAGEKDKDKHILCGIYGNRFVEYMTSHRLDDLDRMTEILATHLHDAMVKLWRDNASDERGPSMGQVWVAHDRRKPLALG